MPLPLVVETGISVVTLGLAVALHNLTWGIVLLHPRPGRRRLPGQHTGSPWSCMRSGRRGSPHMLGLRES